MKLKGYFSKGELLLWGGSVAGILIAFLLFDREEYLTFRRSPHFALAYASNDVVLIVLWMMASLKDPSYLSVTVCFIAFLVNDLYGFINWKKMQARQQN